MSDLGNKAIMAENINRYLARKGMTMKQLAREIDVPYTTVRAWCEGDNYPRIDKIEKMANLFEISKSDLVEKYSETASSREAILQEAFDDPDRRTLFSLSSRATDAQVKAAIMFLKTLLGDE